MDFAKYAVELGTTFIIATIGFVFKIVFQKIESNTTEIAHNLDKSIANDRELYQGQAKHGERIATLEERTKDK